MIASLASLIPALSLASGAAPPPSPAPVQETAASDDAADPAPQEPADDAPTLEERVTRLEDENVLLRQRLEATVDEVERFDLRDVMPQIGEQVYGLGPAASKVYLKDQGLSIGGYGEMVYDDPSGAAAELDFLRAVIYVGYKFDERWIFNSEIEFEHASTDQEGSVSVEFAYLDYRAIEPLNARAGLLLIPMGWINEIHEPTTYLEVGRPQVERRILPTTWRENGAGIFGDAGSFSYRAYVVNGSDATGYSSAGLRGGRQKGSEALAEDLAVVGRLDWTDEAGLKLGVSGYVGGAGQGQAGLGTTTTAIGEAHLEYRRRGLWLRALGAFATVGDVAELNQTLGLSGADSVGEELWGGYATLGYDVLPLFDSETKMSLSPFVSWERYDTQARVPDGFASNPANDETILTIGFDYKPIDQIVFKAGYQDWDQGADRFQMMMGYVF